jgi:hypothetical protein
MTEGRGVGIEQRCIAEFGEAEGAQIIELARALMQAPAAPPPGPRRRVIPIARSEAREAGGTASDAFNAKIVRETVSACATVDDPDLPEALAETVAGLKDIAPTNAREAMLAAQLLGTHAATMDSLALARSSSGPLRDAHLGHAARLAHAHAALSEALDRTRRGDRRVVVLEYRRAERESRLSR